MNFYPICYCHIKRKINFELTRIQYSPLNLFSCALIFFNLVLSRKEVLQYLKFFVEHPLHLPNLLFLPAPRRDTASKGTRCLKHTSHAQSSFTWVSTSFRWSPYLSEFFNIGDNKLFILHNLLQLWLFQDGVDRASVHGFWWSHLLHNLPHSLREVYLFT